MALKSKIEWTGFTINPIVARRRSDDKLGFHCRVVDPSCSNCYAATFNHRQLPGRGTGLPYAEKSESEISIELIVSELQWLLKRKDPTYVFPCSMTDLFGEFVPSAIIQKCLLAFRWAAEKGHVIQMLTKRPERMLDEVSEMIRRGGPLPSRLWFGVSAGRQREAVERLDLLEEMRAFEGDPPLWLSYEPIIGALDLTGYEWLSWVVGGGESGTKARPFHPEWIRAIRDWCIENSVPLFFKQWGSWCPEDQGSERADRVATEALALQGQRPKSGPRYELLTGEGLPEVVSVRVGKEEAGRRLDSRLWTQMPEVRAA